MPGNFIVKASQQPWLEGECRPAVMAALPQQLMRTDDAFTGRYLMHKTDDRAFQGYGYKIMDGAKLLLQGKTGQQGETGWVDTQTMRQVTALKTIMREDQKITEDWQSKLADFDESNPGWPGEPPFTEDYLEQQAAPGEDV